MALKSCNPDILDLEKPRGFNLEGTLAADKSGVDDLI